MRNRLEEELQELNKDLIAMGALCERAISEAIKALINDDKELADKIIKMDSEIDQKEKEIESLCLKILLQQQPMASDLRMVSSALKMITDMERIGDQAADISEIVTFIDCSHEFDHIPLIEMAKATIKMVTSSIDAYVNKDLEIAVNVIKYDDVVDKLFLEIRRDIIDMISKDSGKGEMAVDILMIAKYLERIGDHATNIAEWVEFSITGEHDGND